jgi:hypothetical protein
MASRRLGECVVEGLGIMARSWCYCGLNGTGRHHDYGLGSSEPTTDGDSVQARGIHSMPADPWHPLQSVLSFINCCNAAYSLRGRVVRMAHDQNCDHILS